MTVRLPAASAAVRALVVVLFGGLAPGCRLLEPSANSCPGPYPDQATSPYVLPWRVGEAYRVGQGNCGSFSHAAGTAVEYAYDFLMPVGTPVMSARGGTVFLVEERFTDGTRVKGEENYVIVLHADGSLSAYVHLTHNGALVAVGEEVAQGQLIALSGDSGSSTEPHLHFHVEDCEGCGSAAVTFRNTRAHPDGLSVGRSYRAEAFSSASP